MSSKSRFGGSKGGKTSSSAASRPVSSGSSKRVSGGDFSKRSSSGRSKSTSGGGSPSPQERRIRLPVIGGRSGGTGADKRSGRSRTTGGGCLPWGCTVPIVMAILLAVGALIIF